MKGVDETYPSLKKAQMKKKKREKKNYFESYTRSRSNDKKK